MSHIKPITARAVDYSQWYLDVVAAADLAENSPVHGCMIIKPYGYAIWENVSGTLDKLIKARGAQNAYFPLLIPISFLSKEASHVEGFAKECAVVTHHRLESDGKGGVRPAADSKLEEPLVVRPTSETIIYDAFSRWIQSYRDLPLKLNQWANVVRWEMRTRPFLRTTEFLWQEGHTVHATEEEAWAETLSALDMYKEFAEKYLAIPVILGKKTESEKFPGAVITTSIEALMQDGKALQAGTSHLLGQNFAKVFNVRFLDKNGQLQYGWQTSWGVSTRIMGAIIMTHSDDKGLVLPPKIAPIQVVIVPISNNDSEYSAILELSKTIAHNIQAKFSCRVMIDEREAMLGQKLYEWEKKGVPIRLEIGKRELQEGFITVVCRDNSVKYKMAKEELTFHLQQALDDMHLRIFQRALSFREANTRKVDSWEVFKQILEERGGFIKTHWCGSSKCEENVKKETKATIRCLPLTSDKEAGKCIYCGSEANIVALFARAY